MQARAAAGLVLIALVIPAMSQTTLTIDEIRQKMESAKAAYKGDDPDGFARSIDRAINSLRGQYGDRVPAIAAVKALRNLPLPKTKTVHAPAPPTVDPAKPPEGITVEQTLAGFHLRAVNRDYFVGLIWLVFVGALCTVPVRAFPDLVRETFQAEGLSLWLGGAFLTAYAAAVLYTAGFGAVSAFGEVRITRAGDDGAIFTGIGSLGRTNQIHWSDFRGAADEAVSVYTGARFNRTKHRVALTGSQRQVQFGADLSDQQRAFIIRYLREQIFGSQP